jgi:PAS domain S-box-containing protein
MPDLNTEVERLRAEAAGLAAQLRDLEGARSVILRMDTSGIITSANAFAHEFFDFPQGDLVGRNVIGTIVPPVDSSGRDLAEMVADIARRPEAYVTNENENMRRGSERVWIAWTNKAIRDESGDIVEVLCVGNDITKLRAAQTALAQSEERYRLIAENVSDIIWSMSLTGEFTFVTQSVKRVLGYDPEELIGGGLDDILTPESADRARKLIAERMREHDKTLPGGVALELEHVHRDGSSSWAEVHAKFLRAASGKPIGIVGVTRDITERKKAEDALRSSEEWFRALIELGTTVYAVVDAESRILYESPSLTNVYGWTPDELQGRSVLELVHPDDLEFAKQEMRELLQESGKTRTALVRYHHKNGSWRTIQVLGTNLLDNPAVQGIVLASHDVTDRKKAEDDLAEREGKIAELEHEVAALRSEVKGQYEFASIVGHDPKMRQVFETILAVSKTRATVLITGETGTGKELAAKATHYNSDRSSGPFVKVDCGALAENLLESELFGHERGAFTGAIRERAGRFELASNGTIFLDEIQNLSLPLQAKLLRVVQDGTFERVGGGEVRIADVRIIAASNANLKRAVDEGTFRSDLFYRLNVIPIHLPPLREKKGDILPLASHFVAKYAKRHDRDVHGISKAALATLMSHEWPGNVRELENVIEHAVVFCGAHTIEADDLRIQNTRKASPVEHQTAPAPAEKKRKPETATERELILDALEQTAGNRKRAAELLGIGRTSFYEKLRRHGILQSRN